jgi:thiol-disulfide isomerase/thioredoxin
MKSTYQKNIILVVIGILIVGGISYLQVTKPKRVDPNTAPNVVVSTVGVGRAGDLPQPNPPQHAAPNPVSANPKITLKSISEKEQQYSRAKELVDIQGYVNSPAFKLSDYAGKKVILVDFWTYSCINCQRTIPYLNAWYKKYKDQGLVIVGIHTPEFDFEKDLGNVTKAVKDLGIQYPVVLDSNRGTWQAYQNEYWPHEYLVDIDGFIVHDNIGEGNYAETEHAIQHSLIERDQKLGINQTISTGVTSPSDVITMDTGKVQSPETYFGFGRNVYLQNGRQGVSGQQTLIIPNTPDVNRLYLGGTWDFKQEYAETASPNTKVVYQYNTKNVYMVASAAKDIKVNVLVDGKFLKTVTIKDNKLYQLVNGSDYANHMLELDIPDAGLDAYTFTFG